MNQRPFLRIFTMPAALCALGFAAAMAAVLQYSLRAYIPGSLDPGGFTLVNFLDLLKPLYARVFLDTVLICALTAIVTLLVGYPLAYALVHIERPWIKSAMLIIIVTPLFLGEVVRTYSWIIVLGNNGFINSLLRGLGLIEQPIQFMFTTSGVVVALVHVTLPVMVIMLAAGLSHIDRDYQRAAESLGAGPLRAFRHVFLPLSLPGVVNGCILVFTICLGFYITPILLGTPRDMMISQLINQQIEDLLAWGFASAIATMLLVVTLVLLAIYNRFAGLDRLWG